MTTAEIGTVKLGKLPVRTDVRTLALGRYIDRLTLPPPPATLDLTVGVGDWPMYLNDRIGDCTIAAAGHMIESWTAEATGKPVEVSDADVQTTFDRVKIVDPATGEEGAVELDVLRDWRAHGVGGHTIAAFARVSLLDHDLVRTATWLFEGLYLGIQLPLTAQRPGIWDWTGSLSGPAQPGSWGGHAVDVVRYDADTLTVVTWGRLQQMTWTFWDRYVDEAYSIISTDFLEGGKAPNGFDAQALRADLALVTG